MKAATYRLTAARLLLSTFGDEFDHTQYQYPQVIALNLDPDGKIQACLDRCRNQFQSQAGVSAEKAMQEAIEYVGEQLTQDIGGAFQMIYETTAYKPIYDDDNNVVGHDTITVVVQNGSPLKLDLVTGPGGLSLGGIGVLFMAIEATS